MTHQFSWFGDSLEIILIHYTLTNQFQYFSVKQFTKLPHSSSLHSILSIISLWFGLGELGLVRESFGLLGFAWFDLGELGLVWLGRACFGLGELVWFGFLFVYYITLRLVWYG